MVCVRVLARGCPLWSVNAPQRLSPNVTRIEAPPTATVL